MIDKIYGMVVEFIWYVQPSTFCGLVKFKKEMKFEFRIFRNIFGEGKDVRAKWG